MKINLTMWKQFGSSGTAKGVTRSRQLLNPTREWFVSLVVSLLVGIGLCAHAGWEFYRQSTDAAIPHVSEEHIPRYRAVDAELLIRYYEGKKSVWNDLTGSVVVVPDTPPPIPDEAREGEEETPPLTESPTME